jgi:hypothetical protein
MKYDVIPKSELKNFKRVMPESQAMTELKHRIRELKEDELGCFTLSKSDVKPGTVKMRLLRAAKSLGVDIKAKRCGAKVIFYKR